MKKELEEIYKSEKMQNNIKNIVEMLNLKAANQNQIAERILEFPFIVRQSLQYYASQNNQELSYKIEQANRVISRRNIEIFNRSLEMGCQEQYLATKDWTDILGLEIEMGLNGKKVKTEEEQRICNILEKAIRKQKSREAQARKQRNSNSHNKQKTKRTIDFSREK